MTNAKVISKLTELSARESDQVAKRLGQANLQHAQAEEKLKLLSQYREGYAAQLQQQMGQGLTVIDFNNTQQFLLSLDQAITQQDRMVQYSLQRVKTEHGQLQAAERKRLSYDTLEERCKQTLRNDEKKREQKQTDEFAARKYAVQS